MMSDDKFGDDDDILDDDLDFEELDDLDDSGEDWDDFDDGIVEDPAEDTKAPAAASSEKTFLQKYFNFIVIGIVALGAGLFGLAQFGGSASPELPQQQETADQGIELESDELAAVEDLNDEGMPPMPAPMDPVVDEAVNTLDMPEDTGALTPMPDLTASSEDTASDSALPELSLEIDPLPLEEPITEAELAFTEEPSLELNTEDSALPLEEPSEDITTEEVIAEPAFVEPTLEAPAAEELTSEEIQPIIANEEAVIEDIIAEPVVDNSAAYEAEITQKDVKIQGLEGDLTVANQSIDELKNTVQELEAQMLKLTQDIAEKERIETATKPTAVEEPSTVKEAPVEKAVAKAVAPAPVKPKPAAKKAVVASWTLRSAQPGKAVLASKTTSDLRTVEVGSSVPGLGRITRISVENGKWVVRGTQGNVSQ